MFWCRIFCMSITLEVNQELLEQAKTLSGLSSQQEILDKALQEFIRSRLKQQLLASRGQIEYYEDYDYKAARSKR
jgi:ribosomal protein S21